MASKLEPLNLRITGNAHGLSASLGKASHDVDRFGKGIRGQAARITAGLRSLGQTPIILGGAAAATASIAALGAAVAKLKVEWAALDEGTKEARKLGLAFEELKGLQLGFAEGAGASAESVVAGIRTMQTALFEAAQGSGRAKIALDAMGLDAGRLLQMGPMTALRQISEQMRDLKNPSDQLLATLALFGEESAGFVNALRGGPEALQDAIDWQKQWLDLSDSQLAIIEAQGDAWNRISVAIDGISKTFAAEMAPLSLALAKRVLGIAEATEGWRESLEKISDRITAIAGVGWDLLEARTAAARASMRLLTGDFSTAGQILRDAFDFGTADGLRNEIKNIKKEFEDATPKSKDAPTDSRVKMLDALKESAAETSKALDENAKAVDKWSRAADRFRTSLATPSEQFDAKIAELTGAFEKGGLELEIFQRGVQKAVAELNGLANLKPPSVRGIRDASLDDRPKAILAGTAEADSTFYIFRKQAAERKRLSEIAEKAKAEASRIVDSVSGVGNKSSPLGQFNSLSPRQGLSLGVGSEGRPNGDGRELTKAGQALQAAAEKLQADEKAESAKVTEISKEVLNMASGIDKAVALLEAIAAKNEPPPISM